VARPSPAAVSVTASRRETPFSDAGNRLEWGCLSRKLDQSFIVGLLIDGFEWYASLFHERRHMDRRALFGLAAGMDLRQH